MRYGGGEELDEEARAALKDVGDYCAAHQACYLVITPCSLRPSVTTARRSRRPYMLRHAAAHVTWLSPPAGGLRVAGGRRAAARQQQGDALAPDVHAAAPRASLALGRKAGLGVITR